MTDEQKAAYVTAAAACANARMSGMIAENNIAAMAGETPKYRLADFEEVPLQLGITINQVLALFK